MKRNLSLQPSFEKVINAGGDSFKIEEVYGETLACIYHHHPEFELTYIVHGCGNRLIGTSVEPYRPGDLVLVGGNLPHHYASKKPMDKTEFSLARVIKFRLECFGKDFFQLKEMVQIKKLLELASGGLAFPVATRHLAEPKITELFKTEGPRRIILFLDILNDLATGEKRLLSTGLELRPPDEGEIKRMDKALKYINDNINHKLTLQQVSRAAGLAPAVFSRFFSKVTNKTFSRYVLELRINNACNYLQETDMSISEICYNVGFSNLSNFNRLFKKVKNMSPRAFRITARQILHNL